MRCGAAAALLVALLEETERAEGLDLASKDAGVVGKVHLLEAASRICEQPFVPPSAHTAAARDGVKPPVGATLRWPVAAMARINLL